MDDAVIDVLSVVVVSSEKIVEDSDAVLVLDSVEVLSVVVGVAKGVSLVVDSVMVALDAVLSD